ncbi:hypothetical protein [Micromonospora sp. NPDC050495]|uniref:hypothetical protein n=1 Tax=Micromonospora sp. NPDC050495 TaxID=3154936 RepID=UPI003409E5FE
MQPTENGRPEAGAIGAPAQQAGETCSQSTRASDIPAAWHEQADWENAHQYAEGWAAGYAAGWQAVADEVVRATGVRPYTAKAVIQWLCRSIDLDKRQRTPEAYASSENGMDLGMAEREMFGRLAA